MKHNHIHIRSGQYKSTQTTQDSYIAHICTDTSFLQKDTWTYEKMYHVLDKISV